MKKITETMGNFQNKANEVGAKAMLAASNAAGRAMNTRLGKAALVIPAAVSACAMNVYAAGDGADAQGMIDAIMGVLGPGVIALGSLVAVVGLSAVRLLRRSEPSFLLLFRSAEIDRRIISKTQGRLYIQYGRPFLNKKGGA